LITVDVEALMLDPFDGVSVAVLVKVRCPQRTPPPEMSIGTWIEPVDDKPLHDTTPPDIVPPGVAPPKLMLQLILPSPG
jgi:hypothetical protein